MEIKSYFLQSNRSTAEARHFFASHLNFQMKPCISWGPNPEALAINAFIQNWSKWLICLSAYSSKYLPSGRETEQKEYWVVQNGLPQYGTPKCWRCWQESLFFFQEGSVLSVYFTWKLLFYTRSCNFWLVSYPQITRSKMSLGVRLSKLSGHPGNHQQDSSMPPTSPDGASSACNSSVIPFVHL